MKKTFHIARDAKNIEIIGDKLCYTVHGVTISKDIKDVNYNIVDKKMIFSKKKMFSEVTLIKKYSYDQK